jgi:Flp pilus assembly protein TadD
MDEVARSRIALARHYVDIDRPERALATLSDATGAELADPEFWVCQASALYDLDRFDEGVDAARRGLELDPDDLRLVDLLGLNHLGARRLAPAKQAIDRALELAPDDPIVVCHHALVLAKLGRFEEAEAEVSRALALAPHASHVLRVRAQVASLAGDHARASVYADEVLAVDPEDRVAHILKGNAAVGRARYSDAVRHFEEAARLEPTDDIVEAVRDNRVAGHPLLKPLRPIYRFGRWRAWFVYLALFLVFRIVFPPLAVAIAVVWISLAVLSWTAPSLLRRRERRRRI